MSVWVSVGYEIAATRWVHNGHMPSRKDDARVLVDLAYIPEHLTRSTWVRLGLSDSGELVARVVLDRRAASALRDRLTMILEGERP